MDINVIRCVIADQIEIIKRCKIIERDYSFDASLNYVLVGIRRCGKTTLLYKMIKDLLSAGVMESQITYVNFDDERLIGFKAPDFNDLIVSASQRSSKKHYFFFDEIQNIEGWEKFAIRLANAKEFVQITGSNANMLSTEIGARLGGRYIIKEIDLFSFREKLVYEGINESMSDSRSLGSQVGMAEEYLNFGGFPEIFHLIEKRDYLSNVYRKILLGDVIARHGLRNENSIGVLVKKIAETVGQEVSFNRLRSAISSIGFVVSIETIINYCACLAQSFLFFSTINYYNSFSERESIKRYYFSDNGILNLFLLNKEGILFENMVAVALKRKYGKDIYYVKGKRKPIDVDFYIPSFGVAFQACLDLSDVNVKKREISSLVKLYGEIEGIKRTVIITKGVSEILKINDKTIEVVNYLEFLKSI